MLSKGRVAADGRGTRSLADRAVIERRGHPPPEIFTMGQALDGRALCYTVGEFERDFAEA